MYNNEILAAIKDNLSLNNQQIFECLKYGNNEMDETDIPRLFVSKRAKQEHIICENEILEAFLNGLIILRRGEQDIKSGQERKSLISTSKYINNVVLKKLKIALNLSNKDTIEIFLASDTIITNGQLTGFLRKEGHKNYRKFSDSHLMAFLEGVNVVENKKI